VGASQILSGANKLYLILDGEMCAAHGIEREDFLEGAIRGGAQVVQYRHKGISADSYEKNLLKLADICKGRATLIVNDHALLAETHSLPLHVGQEDIFPTTLKISYGRSTHSIAELEFALAQKPAPSYIALGTMFASPTKPEIESRQQLLPAYLDRTDLRLVLIGGITIENVGLLPQSERIAYAVISDAFRFGAKQTKVAQFVRAFLERTSSQ